MSDATITAPANDPVLTIDVDEIRIRPAAQSVFYRLKRTYQSGAVDFSEKTIAASDFSACVGSFCQSAPRKKFLTWLVSAGYETNLTVN